METLSDLISISLGSQTHKKSAKDIQYLLKTYVQYMYPTTRRCNTFGKFKQHFIFIAVRHRRSTSSNVKFEFKAHKAFKILKWGQPQTSCLTVYSASKMPDAWGSSICGSESGAESGWMVDAGWRMGIRDNHSTQKLLQSKMIACGPKKFASELQLLLLELLLLAEILFHLFLRGV